MFENAIKDFFLIILFVISLVLLVLTITLSIENAKKNKKINSLNKYLQIFAQEKKNYEYKIKEKNNYIAILENEKQKLKLSLRCSQAQTIKQEEISQSEIKGKIGEDITVLEFQNFFKFINSEYRILRNTYLKFNNYDTTEIDIIIISEYGIFVIENKNYSGWVFGDFKNDKWTNSYPNGTKYQFYNPLKQNYTHINVLKKYIDEKYHNMIYSYIVFNGKCELKKVPYNSEFIKVMKSNQIFDILSESLKNKCMTVEEIELLYNNIKFYDVNSDAVRINHKEAVNKKS